VSPELIIALISAVLSLAAGFVSTNANRRARQFEFELERQRKQEDAAETAERILNQYRDPLVDAAHTLQGRLYNIVAQNFLGKFYLQESNEDDKLYARDYTVYAIAEYLCWVEIMRREMRFHDLGDTQRHRDLMARLTSIQYAFQRDDIPAVFQVFRGRQRAVAEVMMQPTNAVEGPRSECVGYAAFSRKLSADVDFQPWFAQLQADVDAVARGTGSENVRLVYLQRELIDLIDFLDPKAVRVPPPFRHRLDEPVAVAAAAAAAV
jgi:hypothetical protein